MWFVNIKRIRAFDMYIPFPSVQSFSSFSETNEKQFIFIHIDSCIA